ncbi:hypothetical protein [Dactylosporangium sp. CA-139066]|uniref:hypothetical protein n=1 Tax=Dactylosporangium sp. CA-139066 TaxID=3239930 RepID=UPI003D8AE67A
MKVVTKDATVRCGHDGRVQNVASQHWVRIGGGDVLVDSDPERRGIVACPNIGPTMKPCTTTLAVISGYSSWVRIGGQAVVMSNLDGLTDGTVPGTVHYTVREPGQTFVAVDA